MVIRFRQIHMDFHTSPEIPDVGADFDGAEFAQILKQAKVDSVTCFAKCHHGMSYYPTEVGVVHPHLKRDLLGEQIEACHRAGINVPVYISVVWDEHAAALHADWLQVSPGGALAGRPPFGNHGWRFLCMNSPYLDYVAAQTEEVVRRYPADGIFFDIVMETAPGCVCNHCMRLMAELGLDPANDDDLRRKALVVARRAMQRLSAIVHEHRPSATIFYNSRLRVDADPETGIKPELQYQTHLEIESLPSGGWGYNHFPLYVRYCQPLGLPTLGMTARFHKTWADFGGLKTEAAMEYECFRMIASGAACSIGDQPHPRGRLEGPVYDRIGRVYGSVAEKESFVADVEPEVDIGVLLTSNVVGGFGRPGPSDEGALRMLLEEHQQFQFVDASADFHRYRVLVAPDEVTFDEALAAKVQAYLAGGGSLLLSHRSGLAAGGETHHVALEEIGVQYRGLSEYTPCYLRLDDEFAPSIPRIDYVLYDQGCAVEVTAGTDILARIVRPYFNRTWRHFSSHNQTPQAEVTEFAGVTRHGRVVYFSHPLFRMYLEHGYPVYRELVAAALQQLLPEPAVRAVLPSSAEVTLFRQKDRRILHLLHYSPQRRSKEIDIVEDALPLLPVTVGVRTTQQPSRAYLLPGERALELRYEQGYAEVEVPLVQGHAMVVLE